MKLMTCNQLGGACDAEFRAETFDEMAALSQQHGSKMHQAQDQAHLEIMSQMKDLMKDPEAMGKWFASKRSEFDALPEL